MAITRAKQSGRIVVGEDGLIDTDQLAAFRENASRPPNSGKARRGIETPPPDVGRGGLSLLQVQTAKIATEARLKQLQLQSKTGELLAKKTAHEVVFSLFRRERDAWLSWPAREVGPIVGELAAQGIEVDQRRLLITLEKYVRQHLDELAESLPARYPDEPART